MKQMMQTPVDALTASGLALFVPLERKELERAQMKELRRTLSYARKNSSFYKNSFSHLDMNSLVEITDLVKLPLISSADVVERGHQLLCVSQSEVARVITMDTSGSTGKPKRFFFTGDDLAATSRFFLHGMTSLVDKTDRVLVLLPFEAEASVGELLIAALLRGEIAAEGHWPPVDALQISQLIIEKKITSLVGLPQQLLALSGAVPYGQIKSMLLCSDYAPVVLRKRIEQNCGCETFLHYGATESGLGGAVECSVHDGVHIREADLLIEIIDPDTKKQLPDGAVGEIVLTTLGRQAMPLIRYRTGDSGSLTRGRCKCGGVTARLGTLYGRLQGCTLSDGVILTSQAMDDLLFQVAGLLDYRLTLEHNGLDRLAIEYLADSRDSRIETVERDMYRLLRNMPEISKLLESGDLLLENIQQVGRFAPTHTQKRTILDLR